MSVRGATSTADFLEFFAGGGMARAGLELAGWNCVFANDFDRKKAASYRRNWDPDGTHLVVDDIRNVQAPDLPTAGLAWASFPCQDLSLAGGGAGLKGERSGTFYPFWDLIESAADKNGRPPLVVLENVIGTLTSHGGADFRAIVKTMADADYLVGALVVDAALFVPQSRPRLFVVAVDSKVDVPTSLMAAEPSTPFHNQQLRRAVSQLEPELTASWRWWELPAPAARKKRFIDCIEENPVGVQWHSSSETQALLDMMSEINLAKVRRAKRSGVRTVGGVYKRTRREDGRKVQRAEVRFDDLAGCLRTPRGGSSRQSILLVEGKRVRSRLISPRETARLMGLSDGYVLPDRYNEAYHLTGDGVVVPVVTHIAEHLLNPLMGLAETTVKATA